MTYSCCGTRSPKNCRAHKNEDSLSVSFFPVSAHSAESLTMATTRIFVVCYYASLHKRLHKRTMRGCRTQQSKLIRFIAHAQKCEAVRFETYHSGFLRVNLLWVGFARISLKCLSHRKHILLRYEHGSIWLSLPIRETSEFGWIWLGMVGPE